jgi:hypothetical protein
MPDPIASARAPRSFEVDSTPTPHAPAPTAPSEPDYTHVFAANTRAPDLRHLLTRMHGAPVAPLAPLAPGASTDPASAKLDALERSFSGPYRIAGQSDVHAAPMFHSNHRDNPQLGSDPERRAFAQKACAKIPGALGHCTTARPTPKELVAVTQALIDAGALRGVSPVTAQSIRDLQDAFHIGVDCIGYIRQSQIALHGGANFASKTLGSSCLQQLDASGLYERRSGGLAGVIAARPGDVLHLDASPKTENREHNVVIRQHDTLTPADPRWASLRATPAGKELAGSGGPVHLLDVVCAGGGADMNVRGVRHETWLYDEAAQRWGAIDPSTKQLVLYDHGPQDHEHGFVKTARRGVQ